MLSGFEWLPLQELKITLDHAVNAKLSAMEGVATRMLKQKVKQGLLGNVVYCEKRGRTNAEPRADGSVRSTYSFVYRALPN